MPFKTDESFLEKLTMGAIGTRRVAEYLAEHGHEIVELERYTTANKIWSIKVKRLRLPDLQCLRCGQRVEARAKTKLEIKLSDSPTVSGREWGAGLGDEDLVALVACHAEGRMIVASEHVALFAVGALREAVGRSRLGPPKSATEGAERDRTWPSTCPRRAGRVLDVTRDRVRVEWLEGRTYTYRRTEDKPYCYVSPREEFGAGDRLLVGAVRGMASPECAGDTWDPREGLRSDDPIEVYGSVKALGLVGNASDLPALGELESHGDERIRLEALGALGRLGDEAATELLLERATDADAGLDMAMEAVLILSELRSDEAAEALVAVGSELAFPEELRAAAVWGLGIAGMQRSHEVLVFLGDESDLVAAHALVALGTDLGEEDAVAVSRLLEGSAREAAAGARVLSKQGPSGIQALLRVSEEAQGDARAWALYGLGEAGREQVEAAAGSAIADKLASLLEPMWRGSHAWLSKADVVTLINFIARQSSRAPLIAEGDRRNQ